MKTTKYIIITSINEPSEAILRFREWPDWHLIVVGDRKSPAAWECSGVTYLGIEEQYEIFGEFAHAIPENTYTRKMLGYIYAIQRGATLIFESDDDNIPYAGARQQLERFILDRTRSIPERRAADGNWLNVYPLFGGSNCWPRGFPIELIKAPEVIGRAGSDGKPWSVLQFLADEDPDVDAIFRLVDGRICQFAQERAFILDEGTFCPFNSQATLWTPEAFPLMFLPLGVSDRVTDILRGYIATVGLWRIGVAVAYASPIVFQKRNMHNLHKDFMQELPLYANAAAWCDKIKMVQKFSVEEFVSETLFMLHQIGAVPENNLSAYKQFLAKCDVRLSPK